VYDLDLACKRDAAGIVDRRRRELVDERAVDERGVRGGEAKRRAPNRRGGGRIQSCQRRL
jgi:hypothetical protein